MSGTSYIPDIYTEVGYDPGVFNNPNERILDVQDGGHVSGTSCIPDNHTEVGYDRLVCFPTLTKECWMCRMCGHVSGTSYIPDNYMEVGYDRLVYFTTLTKECWLCRMAGMFPALRTFPITTRRMGLTLGRVPAGETLSAITNATSRI